MSRALRRKMAKQYPDVKIDCGTCNACCRGDNVVVLIPRAGDDPNSYLTYVDHDGNACLQRQPNGWCIYLDDNGKCSIYKRRPFVCRKFSCVVAYKLYRERLEFECSDEVLAAAKQRIAKEAA